MGVTNDAVWNAQANDPYIGSQTFILPVSTGLQRFEFRTMQLVLVKAVRARSL